MMRQVSSSLLATFLCAFAEPSAQGPYSTAGEYFYAGGFKAKGPLVVNSQDIYLVYPTDAAGPFPIVSFAHGCCKFSVNDTKTDYDAIFRNLASNGVVVASFSSCLFACPNEAFSTDQLHVISVLQESPELHPVLANVDFSRVALMGHSLGGGSTITAAGSGYEGVVAASAIHPSAGDAGDVKVPTFYMCGADDSTVHCSDVKKMFAQTPTARSVFADLSGANHLEIQTPMPGGRWDFYLVQFNLCHLNNDDEACAYIYSTGADAICTGGLMADCQLAGDSVVLA